MVKNKRTRLVKTMSLIFLIALAITSISIVILRSDATRLKGYENRALAVGIVRAKQACLKEGIVSTTCKSINGVVSTGECSGKTCWVVYARSGTSNVFGASVTIVKKDDTYKVIDYLRNPS